MLTRFVASTIRTSRAIPISSSFRHRPAAAAVVFIAAFASLSVTPVYSSSAERGGADITVDGTQHLSLSSTTPSSSEPDCGCSAGSAADSTTQSSSDTMATATPTPTSTSSGSNNNNKGGRPTPLDFKDTPIIDARTGATKKLGDLWADKPVVVAFLRRLGCQLCRVRAQDLDELRKHVDEKANSSARVVCMSFEKLGEGSDKDRSFEAGKYWTGPLYVVDKAVYAALFGRKGLFNSMYGLLDMSSEAMAESKKRGVTGNFAGDGFQLGGQFVLDTDGSVLLEHRQAFYGDDEGNEGLLEALRKSKVFQG